MITIQSPTYHRFLSDWAKLLLTIPQATAVFYIGTSAWTGADGQEAVTPNFVVRTRASYWDMPGALLPGRAAHYLAGRTHAEDAERFYTKWRHHSWAPQPLSADEWLMPRLETEFHDGRWIRIIEVPAGYSWGGPEYLQRIENGLSFNGPIQEMLCRYSPETDLLMRPTRFLATDYADVVYG